MRETPPPQGKEKETMIGTIANSILPKRPLAGRALVLALLMAALSVAALAAAGEAGAAAVFAVNSTGDAKDANFSDGRCDTESATSGNQCTLRAAIEQANETAGSDAIHFNVPGGSEVKTIRPTSELPTVAEAVTIDGYTQPGAKKNTKASGTDAILKVEIDGQNSGPASGLRIEASNVVVREVVINRFNLGGILARGAGISIEGSFIGTDPSGTVGRGNAGAGVTIDGLNGTVGGATPGKRNLISGNSNQGVRLFDSGARVQGNLIGTKKDGTTALDSGFFTGNVGGLLVPGSNNNIGGSAPGEANTIAFNTGPGIVVQSTGLGNRILGNSIFSNRDLGIDLEGLGATPGVTPNDPKDPDTGANGLQNKPVLSSATTSSGKLALKGSLNSTPNRTFVVRFFSNPPDGEEGKRFLGQKSVTTNASGDAFFKATFAKAVPAGSTVTATATGPEGTSEFSTPRTVVRPG